MNAASSAGLCCFLLLAGAPARGASDPSDSDALLSSVKEALSLVALGTVTVQDKAAHVTRRGADYVVRLPLSGFAAPADAALEAVAHPLNGGVWDITSMLLPPAGAVAPNGDGNPLTYTIDEQVIHARIDPGFVQPCSFAARFGGLTLRFDQGEQHGEQTFGQFSTEAALSGEIAGRLNYASANKAENWHLTSHGSNGRDIDTVIRAASGQMRIEGLDRIQGNRMLTAVRGLLAQAPRPAAVPDQPPGISAAQRDALRHMIDAANGLLTRFETDQTFDGVRFAVGPEISGTMNRMRLNMRGDAANERLTTHMDIAADDFALDTLPPETAAYVPHHIDMKSVLAGVRIEQLMAYLRSATEANADPVALQDQLIRLFDEPGTRFAIESLSFDSGPMRMTGSARAVPRSGGGVSAALHLSAKGVDALIAQMQVNPALQPALPVMFIAKGMGRAEGDAVVWNISLSNGAITVNGVPFGQSVPGTR